MIRLIERDLIFDPQILDLLIENPVQSLVLVDKYKAWMDGTVVKLADDFTIDSFITNQFRYNEVLILQNSSHLSFLNLF